VANQCSARNVATTTLVTRRFAKGAERTWSSFARPAKHRRVREPDSARNAAPRLLLLAPILIRPVHLNHQSESQPTLVSHPELSTGSGKTVTALFADLKGSTALMEEMDPEEARAIIDPALHHDRRGQALRRQPRRRPSHATLNTLRAPCIRLAARPRPQLKRPRNISLHSLPNTGVYPLVGSGDERSRSGDGRAGRKEEGIAQMREGLAALQAPTPRRQYLSLLAKA
jgi:hypothetical protein